MLSGHIRTYAPLIRSSAITATVYNPHFAVSSLMLFLLTCHDRGVNLSVTMYMFESVWMCQQLIASCCRSAYLDRIYDLDDSRVSQCSELLESILCYRSSRSVRCYIEGEYTTRRFVLLLEMSRCLTGVYCNLRLTFFVPLCKVQIDSSLSTRSPNV